MKSNMLNDLISIEEGVTLVEDTLAETNANAPRPGTFQHKGIPTFEIFGIDLSRCLINSPVLCDAFRARRVRTDKQSIGENASENLVPCRRSE